MSERYFAMPNQSEIEQKPAEITWAGRLDNGHENPAVWRGKISANLPFIKERFSLTNEAEALKKLDELKASIKEFM